MRITVLRLLALTLGILVAVGGALLPSYAAASDGKQQFAIANQSFWDYYQKRGGVRSFGYPISREFTLNGFRVQLFQRGMLQLRPDGSVATMNLLDSGLMPYSSFNFSVVPSADPTLTSSAPSVSDPDYSQKAIDFVRANTPDQWNGLQVNFLQTFLSTVRYQDAFPNGDGTPVSSRFSTWSCGGCLPAGRRTTPTIEASCTSGSSAGSCTTIPPRG